MNPARWLKKTAAGKKACVYCGRTANTSDHTPPRALLPRKFPDGIQAMTLPACGACNAGFSRDEERAAAIVATVSFTDDDRKACKRGGWLHAARNRSESLDRFIGRRLGSNGIFHPDLAVRTTLGRIAKKSALGLLFFEFGRIVGMRSLRIVAMQHSRNLLPEAFIEGASRNGRRLGRGDSFGKNA